MTDTEIIETLRHPEKGVPREELAEVVRRKEEFIPVLIAEIEHVTRLGDAADPDDLLAWSALFLLAEMRETRALGPILDYLAIDETTEDDIFGDFLGISGGQVLAAIGHNNPQALRKFIRRLDISPWARGAALDALGFQTIWGELPHESFLEFIRELIDTNRFKNDVQAWTIVLCHCLEFHPAELLDSIRKLFERRVVDLPVVGTLQETLAEVKKHPEGCKTRDPEWIQPITNAADAITQFHNSAEEDPWETDQEQDDAGPIIDLPAVPTARETPKIGRNDLCPCGSGKKYKKCCLASG